MSETLKPCRVDRHFTTGIETTEKKGVSNVSTKDSPSLRSCPFCGGEAVLHPTYDMDTGGVDGWFVWCDNDTCECKPETGQFFTEAEAIAAWNTRAADKPESCINGLRETALDYTERLGEASKTLHIETRCTYDDLHELCKTLMGVVA